MNTEQAQNLMKRYNLTHENPFSQPAYLIAYSIAVKGMNTFSALSWVRSLHREDVFSNYNCTWNDTMNVIRMYMGVKA